MRQSADEKTEMKMVKSYQLIEKVLAAQIL